jgi:hypothetical protein
MIGKQTGCLIVQMTGLHTLEPIINSSRIWFRGCHDRKADWLSYSPDDRFAYS